MKRVIRKPSNIYIYRPKALIDGAQIEQEPGTTWVAVPDKHIDKKIVVLYGGAQMTINSWKAEAQMFKRFRDKFWTVGSNRSQYYTLGYFKFRPETL